MIGYLSNKAGGRSGVPLSPSSVAASPFSLRRLYSIKFSRTVVGYSVVCLLVRQVSRRICGEYWQVSAVKQYLMVNSVYCSTDWTLYNSYKELASIFTGKEMDGECSIYGEDGICYHVTMLVGKLTGSWELTLGCCINLRVILKWIWKDIICEHG